ncbi:MULTISPECIES: hypothetical protein [unclassified Paenibacillus]|uniref:hypothetical protein n=1 Tax=unclassified Paenibacillus TaxID=185978 RepID=UPI0011A6E1AC|nr:MULTISPECIES: hypothetical protein [unclassified Paenibacillus]
MNDQAIALLRPLTGPAGEFVTLRNQLSGQYRLGALAAVTLTVKEPFSEQGGTAVLHFIAVLSVFA